MTTSNVYSFRFRAGLAVIAAALVCVFFTPIKEKNSEPAHAGIASETDVAGGQTFAVSGSSWYNTAVSNLVYGSYDFQKGPDAGAYVAGNAANHMHFSINSHGFQVHGNASGLDWSGGLYLTSLQTDAGTIAPGAFQGSSLDGGNLSFTFANYVLEYINNNDGMRQNFVIQKVPAGSDELVLNMQLAGTDARARIQNNALILTKNDRQVYQYADLHVYGRDGKSLPAYMKLSGDALAIHVDLDDAVFPVTVDPLSTSPNWTAEGPGYNDEFGFSIQGGGDFNGDGYADIVVGAPTYNYTYASQGAVFIYYGSPSGLPATPSVTMYGEQENGCYGQCVACEGDVNHDGYSDLLVGSHQYSNPQKFEGKAYLYLGGPSGINTTPVWTMESDRKMAKLGEAVTFAGDLNGDGYDDICVGAHGWDNPEEIADGGNKAGKFWVFLGNATGVNPDVAMSEVGEETDDNVGVSMDKAGDVNGDGYGDLNIGGYIFLIGDGFICTFYGASVPDSEEDFMAIGGATDTSFFAVNLSTAGDLNGDGYDDVVIGMPRFDAGGVYDAGKLHIHYGSPTGVLDSIHEMYGDGQYDERWAFNVNDAGDVNKDGYDDLLVGAKYYNGTYENEGKAELHYGGPNGPSPTPNWVFTGDRDSADIGTNLDGAGDINGDGWLDLIASGDGYSNTTYKQGVVYAFYGGPQVCDPPQNVTCSEITAHTVKVSWSWLYGAQNYKIFLQAIGGSATSFVTTDSVKTISTLVPGTHYKGYVKAKCSGGWTGKSISFSFSTPSGKMAGPSTDDISLYPSPASSEINITTGSLEGNTTFRIFDMNGKIVYDNTLLLEGDGVPVTINDIASLQSGMYILSIENSGQTTVRRFSKL